MDEKRPNPPKKPAIEPDLILGLQDEPLGNGWTATYINWDPAWLGEDYQLRRFRNVKEVYEELLSAPFGMFDKDDTQGG